MNKKIAAFALSAAAAFSPIPGSRAQEPQDPVVTATYPEYLGYKPKEVDCGELIKIRDERQRIKSLVITCEFGKAVDPNDQKVCISGPTQRSDNSSVAQSYADAFLHFATGHNMCVTGNGAHPTGYVDVLRLLGKKESDIQNHSSEYVRNYQSWNGDCPLTRVRNACEAEYKAMGLWADR